MSGEKSALASLVIFAASAVVGILVGGAVWTAVTDAVVQADDGIDLTLAMFDGRSVGAGVVTAIVAALVSVEILDHLFRKFGR